MNRSYIEQAKREKWASKNGRVVNKALSLYLTDNNLREFSDKIYTQQNFRKILNALGLIGLIDAGVIGLFVGSIKTFNVSTERTLIPFIILCFMIYLLDAFILGKMTHGVAPVMTKKEAILKLIDDDQLNGGVVGSDKQNGKKNSTIT